MTREPLDQETVWASLSHDERARYLGAGGVVGMGRTDEDRAKGYALADAERDRRVIDAVVAAIREEMPRGVSPAALDAIEAMIDGGAR